MTQLAPTIVTRTYSELELTNQAAVRVFIEAEKPDQVYMAAARVGGIHANNTYRSPNWTALKAAMKEPVKTQRDGI